MAISTLEFSFPRSFLVKVYQKRYSSPLIEYSASYIAPSFVVKQCAVRTINDERLSKHCQLQIPSESEPQSKEGKIVLELRKLSVDVSNTEIRINLHDISDQPLRGESSSDNNDPTTIDRINFALPYSCVSKIVKNRGGSVYRSEAWYMGQSGVVLPCMLNTSESVTDTGEERLVLVFEGLILSCDISPLTLKFKAACVDKSKKDTPSSNLSVSLPLTVPDHPPLIPPTVQPVSCTVQPTDVSFPLISDSSAQNVTQTSQISLHSCTVPLVSLSVMTDSSSQQLKTTNRDSTLESDESYRSLVHIEEIIAKDFSPKDDDSDMPDADKKEKENREESPDLLGKIIEETILKDSDSENSLERILSVNPFGSTTTDAADIVLASAESAGIQPEQLNKDSDRTDVTDRNVVTMVTLTSAVLQPETQEDEQTNNQADAANIAEPGMNEEPQTDESKTKDGNKKPKSRSKRRKKKNLPNHDQSKEDTSQAKGTDNRSSMRDGGTSDSEKVAGVDEERTVQLIDPVSGLMKTVIVEKDDEVMAPSSPDRGKQNNEEKNSDDDKSNTGESVLSSDEDSDLINIIESIKKSLNEEKSPFTVSEAPQQTCFKMPSDLIPPPGMSLGFPPAADTNSSVPADSFNPEWKMRFPWAYHDDENKVIFCRICIMAKKKNIYTSGSHYFCLNPLFTHTYSKDHTDAVAIVKEQSPDSLKGEGPEWQKMLKQCREHLRSMKSGRINSFKYDWLKEFSWLMYEEVEDKMYCKVCQKHDQDSVFLRGTSRFIRKFIQQHRKCKAHTTALSLEREAAENGIALRLDTEKDIIFGDMETDGSDSEPLRWNRITPEDASSKSSESTPQKCSYRDLFSNYQDLSSGLRSLTPVRVASHMLPVIVLEDVSQSPNMKSGIFDCRHLKTDGKIGSLKFNPFKSSQTAVRSRHSSTDDKPASEVQTSGHTVKGNKNPHKKSKEESPERGSDVDSDSHSLLVETEDAENVSDSPASTKRSSKPMRESMDAPAPPKTALVKASKRKGKKSKEESPEKESNVDSDSHSLLVETEDGENVSDSPASTKRSSKPMRESMDAPAPPKTAHVKASKRKGKKSKEESPERESDVDSDSHSLLVETEDGENVSDSPASTKRSSKPMRESMDAPVPPKTAHVKSSKRKGKKSKEESPERESDVDSDSHSLLVETEDGENVPDSPASTRRSSKQMKKSMEALASPKTALVKASKRKGKKSKEESPERESDVDSDSHSLSVETEDAENVLDSPASTERSSKPRRESVEAPAPPKTAPVKAGKRKGKKSKEESPEREPDVATDSQPLLAETEDAENVPNSPASTKRSSKPMRESMEGPAPSKTAPVKASKRKGKKSKEESPEREPDVATDSQPVLVEKEYPVVPDSPASTKTAPGAMKEPMEESSPIIKRKLDFSEEHRLNESTEQSSEQGEITETDLKGLEKIKEPKKSDYKGLEKIQDAEEILVKFLLNPKEDRRSHSDDAVDVTAWKPVVILKDIGQDTSALHKATSKSKTIKQSDLNDDSTESVIEDLQQRVPRKRTASTESGAINGEDEDDNSSVSSSQKPSSLSKKELVDGKLRDEETPRSSSRIRSTSTDSESLAQRKMKKANRKSEDVSDDAEPKKRYGRIATPRVKPAEEKSDKSDQESDSVDLEKDPEPKSRSSLKRKSGRGNRSESKPRNDDSENESHDDSCKKAKSSEEPKSRREKKGRNKPLKDNIDSESDSEMIDDRVKSRHSFGHKSSRKKTGHQQSDVSSDSDGEPLSARLTVIVSTDAAEKSESATKRKSVGGKKSGSKSTKSDSDSGSDINNVVNEIRKKKESTKQHKLSKDKSRISQPVDKEKDSDEDKSHSNKNAKSVMKHKSAHGRKSGSKFFKADADEECDPHDVLDDSTEIVKTAQHTEDQESGSKANSGKGRDTNESSGKKSKSADDSSKKSKSTLKVKSARGQKSEIKSYKSVTDSESELDIFLDEPLKKLKSSITHKSARDKKKGKEASDADIDSESETNDAVDDSHKKSESGKDKNRGKMLSKTSDDSKTESLKSDTPVKQKSPRDKRASKHSKADNDDESDSDGITDDTNKSKSAEKKKSAKNKKSRGKSSKADSDSASGDEDMDKKTYFRKDKSKADCNTNEDMDESQQHRSNKDSKSGNKPSEGDDIERNESGKKLESAKNLKSAKSKNSRDKSVEVGSSSENDTNEMQDETQKKIKSVKKLKSVKEKKSGSKLSKVESSDESDSREVLDMHSEKSKSLSKRKSSRDKKKHSKADNDDDSDSNEVTGDRGKSESGDKESGGKPSEADSVKESDTSIVVDNLDKKTEFPSKGKSAGSKKSGKKSKTKSEQESGTKKVADEPDKEANDKPRDEKGVSTSSKAEGENESDTKEDLDNSGKKLGSPKKHGSGRDKNSESKPSKADSDNESDSGKKTESLTKRRSSRGNKNESKPSKPDGDNESDFGKKAESPTKGKSAKSKKSGSKPKAGSDDESYSDKKSRHARKKDNDDLNDLVSDADEDAESPATRKSAKDKKGRSKPKAGSDEGDITEDDTVKEVESNTKGKAAGLKESGSKSSRGDNECDDSGKETESLEKSKSAGEKMGGRKPPTAGKDGSDSSRDVEKRTSGRDKKRGSKPSEIDSDHDDDGDFSEVDGDSVDAPAKDKSGEGKKRQSKVSKEDSESVSGKNVRSKMEKQSGSKHSKAKLGNLSDENEMVDDTAKETQYPTKGKSARLQKKGSKSSTVDIDGGDSGKMMESPAKRKSARDKKSLSKHAEAESESDSEKIRSVRDKRGDRPSEAESDDDDISKVVDDSGRETESSAKGKSAEDKKRTSKHSKENIDTECVSGKKFKSARNKGRGTKSSEAGSESEVMDDPCEKLSSSSGHRPSREMSPEGGKHSKINTDCENVSQDQVIDTDKKQKSDLKSKVRKGPKESKPTDEESECERDTRKKLKLDGEKSSEVHSDSDNDAVDLIDSMDLTDSDKDSTFTDRPKSAQEKQKRKRDFIDLNVESAVKKFKSLGPKSAREKRAKGKPSKANTDGSDSVSRIYASKVKSSPLGPKSVKLRKLKAMQAEAGNDIDSDSVNFDDLEKSAATTETNPGDKVSRELLDRLDLTDMMLCHVILHRM